MPGVFTEMCVHVVCFGVPKDWKFLEKKAARLEHVGEKTMWVFRYSSHKKLKNRRVFNIISHMSIKQQCCFVLVTQFIRFDLLLELRWNKDKGHSLEFSITSSCTMKG